jgi:two-component system response regulator PhoP
MVGVSRCKVLIVEDDRELRDKVLLPGLQAFGFDATGVGSAAELYRAMAGGSYRLIVLDIGLPDDDGFSIISHLRRGSTVGIVVLTGLQANADRIRGLTEGADLYLTKPVDVEVLAATLHSLIRRIDGIVPTATNTPRSGWSLEAGGWRLLTPNGVVVALSTAERLIVNRLAASPDEPVPRDALLDELAVHIDDFDPTRLEMLVHRLRRKVAAKAGRELPLTVVRRVGYLLAFGS